MQRPEPADAVRSPGQPKICVFTPSPIYTVTVERNGDDRDEIHFHAGGQGFWVARMAHNLGAAVTIVGPFGGESGAMLRPLIEGEGIDVRAIASQGWNGGYLHDRRSGTRQVVAEVASAQLSRHEIDDLYSAAISSGLNADVVVLAGPTHGKVLPCDVYQRLARDLADNEIGVVADVSGDVLHSLDGGVEILKVSHEELAEAGFCTDGSAEEILQGIRALQDKGMRNVVVSRAEDGIIACFDGRIIEASSPPLQAADPHGAGDSMTAALAVSCGRKAPADQMLRLAVAAGALNVTRHGLGTGSRQDIEAIAEQVELEERALL